MSDDDFDAADSGAADCTPIEAGSVKMGKFLLIKGKPCKVVDVSKAKVGKHGAAKCHFVGVDIFTGKKMESICPASAQLSEPIVDRLEYQLLDITDDGFLCLMPSAGGDNREDLTLPEADNLKDVADKIKNLFGDGKDVMCTVLKAVGQEMVIDCKEGQN